MAASSTTDIIRRAVVVGATAGIGRSAALRLADLGYSVIAVGRSEERGQSLVTEMQQLHPSSSQVHRFVQCDASLIRNIRQCALNILPFLVNEGSADPDAASLDVLVLSQGVGSIAGLTLTAEGIDSKMATHYYGRVAFINELLPALRRAGSGRARVLSVLAAGRHAPYQHYLDDPLLLNHFSLGNAANAACMYNDIAVESLARENPSISFYHAFPGFVNTSWGSEMPWLLRMGIRAIQALATKPEDCARVLCQAILAPDEELKGHIDDLPNAHLINEKGRPVGASRPLEAVQPVWTHTVEKLATCHAEPAQ